MIPPRGDSLLIAPENSYYWARNSVVSLKRSFEILVLNENYDFTIALHEATWLSCCFFVVSPKVLKCCLLFNWYNRTQHRYLTRAFIYGLYRTLNVIVRWRQNKIEYLIWNCGDRDRKADLQIIYKLEQFNPFLKKQHPLSFSLKKN